MSTRLSRRDALVGLVTAWAGLGASKVTAQQPPDITTVDLGQGIEIRDYRLFPTADVMRFIVEVHNTTDLAIDTPAVGVVLPHLSAEENFGWATPVSTVLHPHTSDCLIGVTPLALTSNDEWGVPEWMLCGEITTVQAEWLTEWDIEFAYSHEILGPTHQKTTFEFTNHGQESARPVVIQGVVRDAEDRICGATLAMSLANVEPGQSARNAINIAPDREYAANPFALIDTVDGIDVDFTVQPRPSAVNQNCAAIMPW